MFDFPAAPALRATYASGGITYQYDGTSWVEMPAPVSVPSTIIGKRVAVMMDNYSLTGTDLEQSLLAIQYPIKITGSSLVLTGGGTHTTSTGASNSGWKIYLNGTLVPGAETRPTCDGDIASFNPSVACAKIAHGLLAGQIALCELRLYRDFSALTTVTAGSSGSPLLQVEELV
jgi:hypothetical protein